MMNDGGPGRHHHTSTLPLRKPPPPAQKADTAQTEFTSASYSRPCVHVIPLPWGKVLLSHAGTGRTKPLSHKEEEERCRFVRLL
ncbi:hypothetical protein ZHAS_00001879 [Anopheles sinensis]|uniref:Uncharacterized protein n=1 Tax=Anopheles sinensis TaxID=74873 RepID=A0A084VBM4_ANOSI|nr:hypothetical protein ZHAS_00001879 [Anopheles sinensis]